MSLNNILTEDHPFGPHDQARIKNSETAVALLNLEEPFASLISHHYTLIYGRKGSGKSSAISMFNGLPSILNRRGYNNIRFQNFNENTIFVNIRTWNHFYKMNTTVVRRLAQQIDSENLNSVDFELIPIEVVEELWDEQIWDEILAAFYKRICEGSIERNDVENIVATIEGDELAYLHGTAEYASSMVVADARNEVLKYLDAHNTSVCVLFDTMETYPMAHNAFGASMGGFLRAINGFQHSYPNIFVIFALPEELKPFFEEKSGNMLKDFESVYPLRWSAEQLFRVAAHRYRLFISTADPDFYKSIKRYDLSKRSHLKEFWSILFPEFIVNEFGTQEPPVTYLLRHTQMLPRHIIMHLNRIARISWEETGQWRFFKEDAFLRGIRATEELIARELLVPYEFLHRGIESDLRSSMAGLPPIFAYGKMHKHANRIRGNYQMELFPFLNLLLRAGIIGRLNGKSSTIYVDAEFDYNSINSMVLASNDTLCFHPIFSRFFSCRNHRGRDIRVIYPTGIDTEL